MPNRRHQITQLLTAHPDGLTRKQIVELTGIDPDDFYRTLRGVPNVYIDRWQAYRKTYKTMPDRFDWEAVYCLMDIPHAPRPVRKATEEDLL